MVDTAPSRFWGRLPTLLVMLPLRGFPSWYSMIQVVRREMAIPIEPQLIQMKLSRCQSDAMKNIMNRDRNRDISRLSSGHASPFAELNSYAIIRFISKQSSSERSGQWSH